ncbi:PREDICTED: lethal(3)malignant brain tumor-like protein 3 [Thamnophis sirtalis]|uniref:Lethal(3)malignant brain tumor-like protein 3 n=1 Tax=Thamnophis sirtalis TaxID=35019 RepID=A0A6I9YBJ9_9SAUR|nr:PREDICTED: lethal(3)malignant brain tumor-like protein 3 [Thamnophis sirtalis]
MRGHHCPNPRVSTMNEPACSGNGQDFDVFSVMDWKDGIGTLPGSDLKFCVNEFGALEVITDVTEMESVKKATATTTWMVPTVQEEKNIEGKQVGNSKMFGFSNTMVSLLIS